MVKCWFALAIPFFWVKLTENSIDLATLACVGLAVIALELVDTVFNIWGRR